MVKRKEGGSVQQRKSGKWRGKVYHPLKSAEAGKQVDVVTKTVSTEAEALRLFELKRAEVDAEVQAEYARRVAADPSVRGLEWRPKKIDEAIPNQAYWTADGTTKHVPIRVIRGSSGKVFQWARGCVTCPAHACKLAQPTGKGTALLHCRHHGGGMQCPCGKQHHQCAACLSKDQQLKSGRFCVVCEHQLDRNRQSKHGGPGICAECDDQSPPRIEHLIRPKLLELVDTPAEATDNAHFGADCNVDMQRRPDVLFVVRADDGKLLGIVKFGCDEDSHNRVPDGKTRAEHIKCELGKVGNQFESITMLAYREDVLRAEGSGAKLNWRMLTDKAMEARQDVAADVPMRGIAQFYIKWNPDAYDKRHVPLWEERIPSVAARINELVDKIRNGQLGEDFDYSRPHVSFHYFHSKADDIVQAFSDHALIVFEGLETAVAANKATGKRRAREGEQAVEAEANKTAGKRRARDWVAAGSSGSDGAVE